MSYISYFEHEWQLYKKTVPFKSKEQEDLLKKFFLKGLKILSKQGHSGHSIVVLLSLVEKNLKELETKTKEEVLKKLKTQEEEFKKNYEEKDPEDNLDEDYIYEMSKDVRELTEFLTGENFEEFPISFKEITDIFLKISKFTPLTPLTFQDDEWNFCNESENKKYWTYQNKRCSAIFKNNKKNSKPYFIDAFVFGEPYKGEDGAERVFWFTTGDFRRISSRQTLKNLENIYRPKTYYLLLKKNMFGQYVFTKEAKQIMKQAWETDYEKHKIPLLKRYFFKVKNFIHSIKFGLKRLLKKKNKIFPSEQPQPR